VTEGPRLTLVGSLQNDPNLPNVVWALDHNRQNVQLSANPGTILRLEDDHVNAKIGEYLAIICGFGSQETVGLLSAYALFQGLKRPCIQLGRDDEICVYVMSPEFTYQYPAEVKNSESGRPVRRPKPDRSVFVAYADLKPGEYTTKSGKKFATAGSILFWEWLLADRDRPEMPADYNDRYTRKLWEIGE
jgi:hypothetical protein